MQELFREIEYQAFFHYDGSFVLFVSHYIYKYILRTSFVSQPSEFLLEAYIEQHYGERTANAKRKIFPEIERRLDIQFDSLDINLFSLFFSTLRYTRKKQRH